ncbi:MAG TPA: PLP-dependent aminotransferase family protein [Bryobacteraceae bacterium]|nr:PLP-dependent aminotransferase family protein [Bryobacteraceae bacterium]
MPIIINKWAETAKQTALRRMLSLVSERPEIISFAVGIPPAEDLPLGMFANAAANVFVREPDALQIGPPHRALKHDIVDLMRTRGVECREEEIILTTGAQQALDLLARLLMRAGQQVLVDEVTYPGVLQAVEPFSPEILTVETDLREGARMDRIECLLSSGVRPAFMYVIPDGHNPLGVSISGASRQFLVELARHYGVPLIEDDAYGLLALDDENLPPLRALEPAWVIYVGSFSKVIAPALRAGWIVAPEELIRPLGLIRDSAEIDCCTVTQRVISAYLRSGYLAADLPSRRLRYRQRRDEMHAALTDCFSGAAVWTRPSSGVFMWLQFNDACDTSALLELALEKGVAFTPGCAFAASASLPAQASLRLSYIQPRIDQIRPGIMRIAEAWTKLRHSRSRQCHRAG